jgi:hypothetical protein
MSRTGNYIGGHTLVRPGSGWFSYKKRKEPKLPENKSRAVKTAKNLDAMAKLAQETARNRANEETSQLRKANATSPNPKATVRYPKKNRRPFAR